jgi:hypothetical protein
MHDVLYTSLMPPMLAVLRGDNTSFEGNSYNSRLGASSSSVTKGEL